jgi:hypothetical protein
MTNEELDRWLAEKVMGYDDVAGSSWNAPAGVVRKPIMPSSWRPTTNIAQAIEAATKALKDRRIERWFIGHSIDGMPNRGVEVLDGPVITDSRGEMDDAEFLCRALCIAMAGDS